MKILKKSLVLLLAISIIASLCSCYTISAQKLDNVKGTYKLTHYTYTPSYERKDGYTPTHRNYITDEKYLYEDYLIVTGSNTGYYVHKAKDTEAYSKEITLSYQYSIEEPSRVEYVIFNDALTVNSTMGTNKLGVTKNGLNYYKGGLDYTELFTNRKMRSEDISVRWEKVDKAIDLSYAQSQLGTLKTYDYKAFGARGIYELTATVNTTSGETIESEYQYFYYVIDTAANTTTVAVYYATTEAPTTQKTASVTLSHTAGDWSAITIDGALWTRDSVWDSYYYNESGEIKKTLTCVSNDISDSTLQYLVESRLPTEQE